MEDEEADDLESVTASEADIAEPGATEVVSFDIATVIQDEDTAAVFKDKGIFLLAKAKSLATPIPLDVKSQRSLEERCWRMRIKIVEARIYRHSDERFGALLQETEMIYPNKAALAASGLGVLLNDKSVWPEKCFARSRLLLSKSL